MIRTYLLLTFFFILSCPISGQDISTNCSASEKNGNNSLPENNDSCFQVDILKFENYTNGIKIPYEFSSEADRIITDTILLDEKLLEHFRKDLEITGEMFDYLFGFDIINMWNKNLFYHQSKEDYISEHKKDVRLYHVGELVLDKNYNSHLILSVLGEDSPMHLFRNLFLINIKDKHCKSITQIGRFFIFEGHSNHLFTERLSNNILIQRDKILSTDVIIPEDVRNEESVYDEGYFTIFKYNSEGLLERLY